MLIDGAVTGDLLVADVEQRLVPALRPGDVVVMDNLSRHKPAGVRRAIEAAGCVSRRLPAYSPDLNPIEKAFAKLKAQLRAAARRTVPGSRTTWARCPRRSPPRSAPPSSAVADTRLLHPLGNRSRFPAVYKVIKETRFHRAVADAKRAADATDPTVYRAVRRRIDADSRSSLRA